MRPCLKSHPPTPTGTAPPPPHCARKCVAFQAEACLETVFTADEWDRTPTEPSKKLSYQELLEMKEIQRSLPRANQPADAVTGRAGKHYLSGVPIGLLPLLPESPSSPSPQTSPTTPTPLSSQNAATSWMSFMPHSREPLASPPVPHPSHFSHLPPARQPPPRQKPRFAFLPLTDSASPTSPALGASRSRSPSPARSETDPPTPTLTYASLESSPMSQASSCSTEPSIFQLSPTYADDESDSFPRSLASAMQSMKTNSNQTQTYPPRPSFPSESNHHGSFGRSNPAFKPTFAIASLPPAHFKPKRKRNVIVINDIEVELDDSDDEEEVVPPSSPVLRPQAVSPPSSPSRTSSSPSSPSSITSNGLPTPPPSTSPSPTLSQRLPLPPVDTDSPFSGLHAPISFKRKVPAVAKPSSPVSSSPPQLSTSPTRRGSICGVQSGKQRGQARAGPILVPGA